ncbi:pectinesterase-like protein [Tanacetum coccineum]
MSGGPCGRGSSLVAGCAWDVVHAGMGCVQTRGPGDYYTSSVTMTPLAHNRTSTPANVLNAAILAIIEAVNAAGAAFVSYADNDINHNQRLDDCKELMGYAVEELLASSRMLTCLDGFNNEPELRAKMDNLLLNATQLTSNALAIVASTPIIFKAFDHIPSGTRGQKLLGTHKKGYPSWMSVDDQKLLGNSDVVLRPHAVVAKEGSGQFKTIMGALAAYPNGNVGTGKICCTIITGNRSHKTGWTTYKSATLSAIGSGFIAKSMGFQNTAGPEAAQAVALHSQSDRSAFFDIHIDGYQNTLYTHTHRQFYGSSIISGTVDFIFGDAAVIIQNCLIISVSSQVPSQELFRTSIEGVLRTIVMESVVDDFIQPDGWLPWQGTFALDTCFYGEYANVGGAAGTDRRAKWKGFKAIKDKNEAMQYTAGEFVQGNGWLKGTGAPFYLGLKG